MTMLSYGAHFVFQTTGFHFQTWVSCQVNISVCEWASVCVCVCKLKTQLSFAVCIAFLFQWKKKLEMPHTLVEKYLNEEFHRLGNRRLRKISLRVSSHGCVRARESTPLNKQASRILWLCFSVCRYSILTGFFLNTYKLAPCW